MSQLSIGLHLLREVDAADDPSIEADRHGATPIPDSGWRRGTWADPQQSVSIRRLHRYGYNSGQPSYRRPRFRPGVDSSASGAVGQAK